MLALHYSIGHTLVRAGVWTSVRRLLDHAPMFFLLGIVALAVVIAVGQWFLRGNRRRRVHKEDWS